MIILAKNLKNLTLKIIQQVYLNYTVQKKIKE